jgi:hypothetical protein
MAKFRSWNEELQAFIYFEDGEFSFSEDNGKSEIHFDYDDIIDKISSDNLTNEDYAIINTFDCFDWQNTEQSTVIRNIECFVGDDLEIEITFSRYGGIDDFEEKIVRGILKFDNSGFYIENDNFKGYLNNLTIIDIEVYGNIHENKEIL